MNTILRLVAALILSGFTASAGTVLPVKADSTTGVLTSEWVTNFVSGNSLAKNPVPPDTSFCFIGDSITYGQNTTNPATNRFSYIVSNDPIFQGHATERNFAASGASIAAVSAQYTADVAPIISAHAKTYLFILTGRNDGTSSAATIYSSIMTLANTAASAGCVVYLATIPAPFPPFQQANELLRNNGVYPVVDYNSILAWHSVLQTTYFTDGEHPTNFGHQQMAKLLTEEILNPYKSKQSFNLGLDTATVGLSFLHDNMSFPGTVNGNYFFGGFNSTSSDGIGIETHPSQASGTIDATFSPSLTVYATNSAGNTCWSTVVDAVGNEYGFAMGAALYGAYSANASGVQYPVSWAAMGAANGTSGLQPSVFISPLGHLFVVPPSNAIPGADTSYALNVPQLVSMGGEQGDGTPNLWYGTMQMVHDAAGGGGQYFTDNVPAINTGALLLAGANCGAGSGGNGGCDLAIIGNHPYSTLYSNPYSLALVNNYYSTATDSTQWGIVFSKQGAPTGANQPNANVALAQIDVESITTSGAGTGALHFRASNTSYANGVITGEMLRLDGNTKHIMMGQTLFQVGDDGVTTDMYQLYGGDLAVLNVGSTVRIKSGTNALAGTVTLSSGAATITSTAIDVNTVIVPTIKTVSGTPGTALPSIKVSAGSATVTGLSTDNSTYNWVALKVN